MSPACVNNNFFFCLNGLGPPSLTTSPFDPPRRDFRFIISPIVLCLISIYIYTRAHTLMFMYRYTQCYNLAVWLSPSLLSETYTHTHSHTYKHLNSYSHVLSPHYRYLYNIYIYIIFFFTRKIISFFVIIIIIIIISAVVIQLLL